MAELDPTGAPLSFDEALKLLTEELGREAPTARRALGRPQVRAGGLPNMQALPPRQEVRSAQPQMPSIASSPMDYFRANGQRMAGMSPEEQMNELGRTASMGAELTSAPGLLRAGNAAGDAMIDPSIPNITNAGVQTGMALMRPGVALGSLGAGYAGAAAKDVGLLASSEAQAQAPLTRKQQRDMEMERQRAERDAALDLKTSAASKDRAEYDRSVATAEAARDKEFARDKRSSDTEVGKLYDKTGGYAPLVAGFGSGVVNRAAGGPAASQLKVLGWGGAAGAGAANIPLIYNALFTEPDNPKKRGYEAMAEALPPNHPRRQEYSDYAASLPGDNPVRSAASKELYDPVKLAERVGMGGLEGMLGAEMGLGSVAIPSRAAAAAGNAAGNVWAALKGRPGALATTEGPLAGTLVETNALSQRPTAGAAPSADILPGSGGAVRNGLAGPAQRQLPSPEASPNRSASGLPSWASEPPAGVILPRNTYWDANRNQPRHQDGTYVEMPKYRHPK